MNKNKASQFRVSNHIYSRWLVKDIKKDYF